MSNSCNYKRLLYEVTIPLVNISILLSMDNVCAMVQFLVFVASIHAFFRSVSKQIFTKSLCVFLVQVKEHRMILQWRI